MADTITFRPDEDAARALAVLTRDGTSVSTAVRSALAEQTAAVDPTRLGERARLLTFEELRRVDAAFRLVLGL